MLRDVPLIATPLKIRFIVVFAEFFRPKMATLERQLTGHPLEVFPETFGERGGPKGADLQPENPAHTVQCLQVACIWPRTIKTWIWEHRPPSWCAGAFTRTLLFFY
jgi:hypothetical protein